MVGNSRDSAVERIDLNDPLEYSVYQNHIGRYIFARQFVQMRNVLDIASGTGYGSRYLTRYASHVVACDLSLTALRVARERKAEDLALVRADACHIPCKDSVFDTILCFETIEHLKKSSHDSFFIELRRVLRVEGLLVCSTPRREVVQVLAGPAASWSPFHMAEMTLSEFKDLVSRYFRVIDLLGQDRVSVRWMIKAWVGYGLRGLLGKRFLILREIFRRIRPHREISPVQSGAQIDESLLDTRFSPKQFERASFLSPVHVVIVAKKPA